MPAYNAEAYIEEAIQSVIAQTYKYWELIVIDDGSTDRTANIVKTWQRLDSRIVYHHQTNKGLGAARNAAFGMASGEWIALLDADDLWHKNKIKLQLQTALQTNTDLIFSQGHYLEQSSGSLKPYDSLAGQYSGRAIYQYLIIHNHLPALSVFFKREILSTVGLQGTQPIIKGNEDWDYWLRICKTGDYMFLGMTDRLFKYRVHSANMSGNQIGMRMAALYVQAKNYVSTFSDPLTKKSLKNNLMSSVPFLIKNTFNRNGKNSVNVHIKLLLRILIISGSKLPAFLLGKMQKSIVV